MTIDERLENISQQLEILTGMQHANERRFEEIERRFQQIATIFTTEHESIQMLENIARRHEERLDELDQQ